MRSLTRIRLTTDDLAIIHHVGRHRFLRSTHLMQLLPHRPPKKLIERIGALFHAGYLDRPRAQLDYYSRYGSAPMVYALGDRSEEAAPEFADVDWSDKNRTVKRPYIEHSLMIADIMIAIEIAARSRSDLEFIDAHTLAAHSFPTAPSSWSLAATVTVTGRKHRVNVVPDAVFALRFKSTGRCAYFFVEADRGTMTIDSTDITQSSVRRKIIAYHSALKCRQHVERFGFDNLRVLVVTTSEERVISMLDVVDKITRNLPTGRFLFSELTVDTTDLLSRSWRSNTDRSRIDLPTATSRQPEQHRLSPRQ